MDFKVTYLDAGLTSTYFSDSDTPSSNGTATNNSVTPNSSSTKVPKRYKAHLRDFLSSCRTKRSKHTNNSAASSLAAANVVNDIYAAAAGGDPAAAATASAIPYASVYGSAPTSAGATTYSPTESPLYMQQNAITSPYQTIYPVDNRYFSTEYLASYRSLTTYYPEYAASAHAAQYIAGNGYFDSTRPLASLSGYDPSQFNRYFEDNKNPPECKYKADFTPSITTTTALPPPPPPHSTGKIFTSTSNPNDETTASSRQDTAAPNNLLLNAIEHDDVGGGLIGGSIPPGIEKNNHRLLCSSIINGPLSVHPSQSISLTTDNITLTNPNTTLLYHGSKHLSSPDVSEEKHKTG